METGADIAIFAAGSLDERLLAELSGTEFVIGADRAAYWLLVHDIIPDVAVGDFDSVSPDELSAITTLVGDVRMHPPEKDKTDLELAVDVALSHKPRSAAIFGGLGGRFDHTLATVQLLERFMEAGIPAALRDNTNEVFLLTGSFVVPQTGAFRYCSVVPYRGDAVVSMSGFKYPTDRVLFRHGSSLGVSNEVTGQEATIEVHEGMVLVVRSSDSA